MKRAHKSGFLLGVAFLLLGSVSLYAQKAKDIFSSEAPLTWFGVDFSEARLIGDIGANEMDVRNSFSSINQLMVNEVKKYDFPKIFHKSAVATDITPVVEKAAKVDAGKIKSSNTADASRFTKATIEGIVKGYKFGDHKGTGVLFVMEGMNKTAQEGSMYVVFFDIASKKVLLSERMIGKAGGFGFKNYWTGAVFKVLKEIEKKKYEEWRSNNP